MNISSLYQNIADQKISVNNAAEPPPIINSDVNQYANILAKKPHLNQNKTLIKENVSQPLQQQTQQTQQAQQPGSQPATNTTTNTDINKLFQGIQKKYSAAVPQEKALIAKILTSLS